MAECYTVRPAREDDLGMIAAMWADMGLQHRQYDPECWDYRPDAPERFRQHLAEMLSKPACVVLVAADDADLPVGFLNGEVKDAVPVSAVAKTAMISNLFVSRPHRRKGLGRRLMEAALEKMKSLGAQEVALQVAQANVSAIRLYEKLGLRRVMVRMYKRL